MMEAVQTSETLVNSYQSTLRYDVKDSHLVEEAFDPYGVEGFSHIRENRAS
jgi:hypothetical protein